MEVTLLEGDFCFTTQIIYIVLTDVENYFSMVVIVMLYIHDCV